MKLKKLTPRKGSAQAIVEFAIALPVLLLLVYGLLETGRYLFLYSTVVNASRQAVRYGSATGTGNNSVPRYQDCNGIRAAATRGAFIANFDTITIKHDEGLNSSGSPINEVTYCGGATDTSFSPKADNTSRITVEIVERYTPIIPRLVPFIANDIRSSSSRTILLSVSIVVTSPPILSGSTPTFTSTATSTPTQTPTQTPSFTPTSTNTPITYTPTNSATPTISRTPTITLTPSHTPTPSYTPTPSFTPTASKTPISNCGLVTHGPEVISGSTFSMTITNPTGIPLEVQDVTVYWDNDSGHQTGSDKTLRLQSASLVTTFWTGNVYSASYTVPSYNLYIPTGTSTISFTFSQTYSDTSEGSQRIFINLATNGCQLYAIDSDK